MPSSGGAAGFTKLHLTSRALSWRDGETASDVLAHGSLVPECICSENLRVIVETGGLFD
jgi:hypothetical protein